jgi:cell division septum initiation protein DivIVA
MDILQLVDRLEDLIDEGRHLPFSKFTMIDEERALAILDQMRISIPEEIVKATTIIQERNRIMERANEDAARLLQESRKKSDELLDQETSVQAAQARAHEIIERAKRDAEQIMEDADKYVADSLRELEKRLNRIIAEVRNGIAEVENPASQIVAQYKPAEAPKIMQPQDQDVDVLR